MGPTKRADSGWHGLSRRQFLAGLALAGAGTALAACGGSAQPAPSTTAAGSVAARAPSSAAKPASAAASGPAAGASSPAAAGWDQVLAAAKGEGKVVVNTFPGKGNQVALDAFNKAYADVKLEQTTLVASALAPRILQERKAGLYTWDVLHMPTTTALQVLNPAGVFDPIKPAIVLPEVLDDKAWRDGFAAGFRLTNDKQLCYAATHQRLASVYVNADQANPEELKTVKDLLNPKWKGKIVCTDPRISGSSFFPFTLARLKLGDDVMKQFFVDQQPVITTDGTQAAQFVARGNYPIGIGLVTSVLADFQKQGIGKNIKQLTLAEFDAAGPSTNGVVWLVNKAPHPNAARLYINWFLSKDGQTNWTRNAQDNSRRLDVEPGEPQLVVPPGLDLPDPDEEKFIPELAKTQDLAKQLIK